MAVWLRDRPARWYTATANAVLDEMTQQLGQLDASRPEYLMLTLHTLWTGLDE